MELTRILYEKNDGVATITLNVPEKLNAMDLVMREEFHDMLVEASADKDVRAIIWTGAGRSFCSGSDIGTMEESPPNAVRRRLIRLHRIPKLILDMEKPVIAAVNGHCYGAAFNMALACDYLICDEKAKFCQSFVKIGLIPDAGAFYMLSRRVGVHKAKELVLFATALNAQEAVELGIANRSAKNEELLTEVYKVAKQLADGPTVAIGLAKVVMNRCLEKTLEQALSEESFAQEICTHTADFTEGVKSFMEKRPPKYLGR